MLLDVPATAPVPAPSVEEILAAATGRTALHSGDGKSGSRLERFVAGGCAYVAKWVHPDCDWTMRVLGDLGPRPLLVWRHRLLDVVPDRIDHTVVGAAPWGRNGWGAVLVMRDVSGHLVPPGDGRLPAESHLAFLSDCAALCAATWGWTDTVGLVPYAHRWLFFSPAMVAVEEARGWPDPVPRIAADGWERFARRAPAGVARAVEALRADPTDLVRALAATPSCFLHGDWKLGNLGRHPDGRTILLDCAYPGEGPACHELAFYLALNRARLPEGASKEWLIDAFRTALEGHGVDTAPWWDRQLALCLLGGLVQFGWEKALGDDDELAWWCRAAAEGLRWL